MQRSFVQLPPSGKFPWRGDLVIGVTLSQLVRGHQEQPF
jgi:hypothetical protein